MAIGESFVLPEPSGLRDLPAELPSSIDPFVHDPLHVVQGFFVGPTIRSATW